mmetsp:Transcript_2651/g.4438  ORF Transcript_2651/g.4438 Transcript_2651/m.4438 type:complete len:344 (+) Transcript_2651:1015-2046(+)
MGVEGSGLGGLVDVAGIAHQERGHGGEVVVDEAAEGGEDAHEEEEVAHGCEQLGQGAGLAGGQTEVDGEEGEDGAVHDVAEHDAEEEGESDAGKVGGVDLLVGGRAVGVHDQLEGAREFVGADQGGFGEAFDHVGALLEGESAKPRALYDLLDLLLELEGLGAPDEALQDQVGLLEHVQVRVDGSLAHDVDLVDLEDRDGGFSSLVDGLKVLEEDVLGLPNDVLVAQLLHLCSLDVLHDVLEPYVEAVGREAIADSSDFVLENGAVLEGEHENVLPGVVVVADELVVAGEADLEGVHVDLAAGGPDDEALELGEVLGGDDAADVLDPHGEQVLLDVLGPLLEI